MSESLFEATLNDRSLRLTITDDEISVDGEAHAYSFVPTGPNTYSLLVDGQSVSVVVEHLRANTYRVTLNGYPRTVTLKDEQDLLLQEMGFEAMAGAGEKAVRAPMPGLILSVEVDEGDSVEVDDELLVIEAMKMENELRAPVRGTIIGVHVAAGDTVDKDELLIEIEPDT